jgi:hypothetical protein
VRRQRDEPCQINAFENVVVPADRRLEPGKAKK